MARIEKNRHLNKEKYTLYGQWILWICSLCGIDQGELARRADLDKGTISTEVRRGKNEPTRQSVKKAIAALHQLCDEKGVEWQEEWDDLIMTGAGKATDKEIAASQHALERYIASKQ